MFIYPLILKPYLAPRIWGGKGLATLFPSVAQAAEPIGEVWIVGGSQVVANGPYAGQTLDELYRCFPSWLGNGQGHSEACFPLLIKWLRAEHWLSIQVHPNDSWARRLSGRSAQGKEEAWYVTESLPGAELILGVHPHSRCHDFLTTVGAEMLPFLSKIKPTVGDCLAIKPGAIHALGPGLTVLEVQQNSQLTYRLYDWDRLSLEGQPRQLHVREAAAVLPDCWSANLDKNKQPGPVRQSFPSTVGQVLLQAEHFRLEVIKAEPRKSAWLTDPLLPEIIVCTSGTLQVSLSGQEARLPNGQACLLAAGQATVELGFESGGEAVRITSSR